MRWWFPVRPETDGWDPELQTPNLVVVSFVVAVQLKFAVAIMKLPYSSRLYLGAAFVLLAAGRASARFREPGTAQPPPAIRQNRPMQRPEARSEIRPVQSAPAVRTAPNGAVKSPPREEHLEKWMQSHGNLSLSEQQRALQNEPGFRELPRQMQQNRLNMLGRLYNMNPQQRSRMLNGVENLERLSPQQQQQWDHAVQQLHGSPIPRRRMMIHAIADLREMPPDQRQQVIDSPRFAGDFSPEERQAIRTILTVYPPNRPAGDTQ